MGMLGLIVSNFPRSVNKIELDNGVTIKMEVNENLMAIRDPDVSKKITIDYGKGKVRYKTSDDHYNFHMLLVRQNNDTLWVIQDDQMDVAQCPYNEKDAQFRELLINGPDGIVRDTLLEVKYEDFAFMVE
jgi:translation initiation factor IF-1